MGSSFFISVGEPSGDLLASELLVHVQKELPGYQAFGIGGPKLSTIDNYEVIADISELAVMGFAEVIRHLSHLKRLEDYLLAEIDRRQPEFAILVDYPGFNLRLAEFLRARKIKVIQYVAPQLWAWGEKRTEKLRRLTDLVLGIMPFEKNFFIQRQVNYRYVGTPQVDRSQDARQDRIAFQLDDRPCIGFFPGSRKGEISRMLPLVMEIIEELGTRFTDLQFAVSMSPAVPPQIFQPVLTQTIPDDLSAQGGVLRGKSISLVRGRSLDLMKSVDAALVTSGTATLECGLVKTPLCVAYRMNPLSYKLAKHLVKIKYISLVNLVADEEVIREFIQNFTASDLANELYRLSNPGEYRNRTISKLNQLDNLVDGNLAHNAAVAIRQYLLGA